MELVTVAATYAARTILVFAFFVVSFVPVWTLAGRILEPTTRSRFRALCAAGFALVLYISVVNLVGRLTNSSFMGVAVWFLASAVVTARLWRSRLALQRARGIIRSWRGWAGL